MYQMSSGRWSVVGLVSWGENLNIYLFDGSLLMVVLIDSFNGSGGRCAEKDKPGVYTRVTAYTDWIKAKVLSPSG